MKSSITLAIALASLSQLLPVAASNWPGLMLVNVEYSGSGCPSNVPWHRTWITEKSIFISPYGLLATNRNITAGSDRSECSVSLKLSLGNVDRMHINRTITSEIMEVLDFGQNARIDTFVDLTTTHRSMGQGTLLNITGTHNKTANSFTNRLEHEVVSECELDSPYVSLTFSKKITLNLDPKYNGTGEAYLSFSQEEIPYTLTPITEGGECLG